MLASLFDTSFTLNDLWFMLEGAGVTLAVTVWAVIGGTLLGFGFGLLRAVSRWWINAPPGFLLDIPRSVPLLIQLVLANAYNSIIGLDWDPFTVGCMVLAVYYSAYCSEIVRAGVLAVPATTRRAARSLGMTWQQDLTYIIFPLALRVGLPSWIGLTLGVMKDTAMVWWIGIIELLRSSQIIITRLQEPLFVLSMTGLIYFLMSFPIARLGGRLERRWRENE
jgi:polar amino acid transport system permease protein